jgi:glycosyltransferase involved in cell wall biosynthesis
MKLFYITRVEITSTAAQSVQIYSMCKSFGKKLKNFKLISPLNYRNEKLKSSFNWDKIHIKTKFKYLELLIKSVPKVIKEKPTHIFTRDIVLAFIFSFFNIKVIYEVHKEPKTNTAYFLLKLLRFKKNFLLVSISKALEDYYFKFGYKKEKLFYYHDGVFIEKYDKIRNVSKETLRKELNLPADRIIVMHTGSLYEGRGAELFEVIIKNFPDVYFVQVGGSKEYVNKWQNYYKDYDNIQIIGHQDNDTLIKYQMSADLLFLPMTRNNPIWWCTSPMKLFEYMATGIPILGSNIGSVGEVLTEKNAIIFNPENKQTIINGVNFFLKNREEALKKTQIALKDIREKYIWDKRVKKILEFIR